MLFQPRHLPFLTPYIQYYHYYSLCLHCLHCVCDCASTQLAFGSTHLARSPVNWTRPNSSAVSRVMYVYIHVLRAYPSCLRGGRTTRLAKFGFSERVRSSRATPAASANSTLLIGTVRPSFAKFWHVYGSAVSRAAKYHPTRPHAA